MKKLARALTLLLVAATLLSGCSMLTTSGRQQRAYERYVKKSSLGRVKQQKRMGYRKTPAPIMQPSEPMTATEVSGPEAIGDGSSQ